ncbi:Ribonuclease HII [Carpediemonas membranifera]|uniref:Ribonuclease n=1 Tax=Carpediemonas membranifera TaxID=201153 RepID=A0A8J6E235_9EUKA|nr:Ribonuclease HII [Carpediemonas membranifera]|eukprot:KAG9393821.1 Ribonuclease HII [Carpediemonas membranifera]
MAGRGPVIGPMVYGICWSPEEHHQYLREVGMNDSKQLDHAKRSELVKKLSELEETHGVGFKVTHLTPEFLSEKMLAIPRTANLNSVSHEAAASLINHVVSLGHHVTHAYIDTVGDPGRYAEFLRRRIPQHIKLTVEPKADGTYPVTAAASIAAKTSRDSAVEELCEGEAIGPDWVAKASESMSTSDPGPVVTGSGYPGDPKTKAFLRTYHDRVFGFPPCIRFSWKTAERVHGEMHGVVFDFGDEDDATGPGMGAIMQNRPLLFRRKRVNRLKRVT